MSTESFTRDIILSEDGTKRLMKIKKEPCEYCIDGIEVETVVIDGLYYTMEEDTKFCPYCGRKLEDV
jgi:RNA polymerase subunit RPABC4/transcription elongation factor Spt4